MNRILWFVLTIVTLPLIIFSSEVDNKQDKEGDIELIDKYLILSAQLVNRNLDSAMYYAEKANQLIASISSDSARIVVYVNLGTVYHARGNFALSIRYYLDAKKLNDNRIIEEPKNVNYLIEQAGILNRLGVVYYSRKDLNQSLAYYNEALDVLEKASSITEKLIDNANKFKILNNIAAIYIQQENYTRALDYYKSALEPEMLLSIKTDSRLESSLYNNMGICYMELKDFIMADNYFRRSLSMRKWQNDLRGAAQCLNNIGKNYVYNGDFNQGKENFLEALKIARKIGNKESMMISLQSLTSVYDTLKDYKNAISAFREFKDLSDSLFNIESVNKIAQLEMQYEFDKQQQIFDIELKRKEAEQQKAKLRYVIIGGSLLFLLVTTILLLFLQKSKTKNVLLEKDKLELENKNFLLERKKLQEDLEYKNRELATNVMYLLKKNELITIITEKLIQLRSETKSENQKIIQEIINELKSTQDRDVWSEFEAHFTQVHLGFYERLHKLFPDLTSNEKKLCAFLRLNMSTKDISAITYQSVNSITVARSRLRKKLNIQGEEVNLINFLVGL